MKCAICKNETNWDESFGHSEFIVCPKCFERLERHRTALGFILTVGKIIKEKEAELK